MTKAKVTIQFEHDFADLDAYDPDGLISEDEDDRDNHRLNQVMVNIDGAQNVLPELALFAFETGDIVITFEIDGKIYHPKE